MSLTSRIPARAIAGAMLAVLTSALGACSSFEQGTRGIADALTLYKPEVVQGNFVSKEQVAALQPGMSRVQVRDTLAPRWSPACSMPTAGTTCSPCAASASSRRTSA